MIERFDEQGICPGLIPWGSNVTESQEQGGSPKLKPLPYHQGIRDYLKTEEPEVWQWYASNRVREEQAESIRFDLLKSTYRVERDTQPQLYEAAEEVANKLALDVPITIYQAQNPAGLNASLAFLPHEAHIVLHGPVTSKLTDLELRALLGHELSHLLLWRDWEGDYILVDQILAALTLDRTADAPHFTSARLFGLYTEIFCDRGSLSVVHDPLAVVSMLVKIETELEEISAESYLRQAEEIFSKGKPKADQLTHPEAFIRARAIKLWAEDAADADLKVAEMIEGDLTLNELDLLGQQKVASLTRRLIDVFLGPRWMQTELTIAHARMFFDGYGAPHDKVDDSSLPDDLRLGDKPMRDYYCFVLLDFVTADRDLEELPLAAALVLSERLGLKRRFVEIARKEMRLRKKQIEKIDEEKDSLLAKAAKRVASS